MRVPIDKAGRLVIPKALRDEVGLRAGEVELVRDGAGIRVEPVVGAGLEERDGLLVIPSAGAHIDDEDVRRLRDADQR
jgi:AbrB family looped-hinge helix DNA binding protein